MELLAILAALVALAIPVSIILLFVGLGDVRARLRRAEAELARLRAAERPMPVAAPTPENAAAPVPEAVLAPGPEAEREPEPANPWAMGVAAAQTSTTAAAQDGPVVLTAARASALGDWLRDNWVYAVSALSLAFAGIFFVQYGIEKGLLSPGLRVTFALLFGLSLIAAGEWVRRKSGDGARASSAYVPSTFAGAGLVSMFAGVLAARQLYGLIGVEAAFAGLVAVAALGLLIGWFYGPFLAAFGLIGAAIAPFAVGGSAEAVDWLYGYFGLIAALGLGIDAARRWAWVSVLALALAYAAGFLLFEGSGGSGWFLPFLAVLALLAVLVPCLRLWPDHDGPMVAEALRARGQEGWPIFPVRLAAGSVGLSTLGLALVPGPGAGEGLLAFLCLAALAAVLIVWSRGARALSDLSLVPAAGFLVRLWLDGFGHRPLAAAFGAQAIGLRPPETAPDLTASGLLALATALSLLAAWASGGREYRAIWAAAAALIAPVAAVILELFWAPGAVLGSYLWALHAIALAALMAGLAARFAAADGADRRRAAHAALSCLSLIALALFLVLTKGALTLALSALLVFAAALDRRFRLPEMGWFIQAAIVTLGWRLVIDPGLVWAIDEAALWEVIASYGGAAAAAAGGLSLLAGLDRRGARVFLDSGAAAFAALLANVLITRALTGDQAEAWVISHWALALNAMPWLILALVQLYRLQLGGALRWLRWAIAAVAGLLAAAGLGAAAGPASPLLDWSSQPLRLVYGPPVLDTLLVAYGLPAALIGAALSRLGHLNRWLRHALAAAAAALAALYAGLEIRRLWRGDDLSVPGVTQYELYSYTIALMALGAILLWQAIARGSAPLRRAAMAVIALTVAKVFLIDAAGLSGLTRVFSFLALGLSLAGLAWLNRWAAGRGRA
jgi:uncharacterized membrane protein